MVTIQGWPLSELLRITGLTVRYGIETVIPGLDLTVSQGELFVLLGGSGSGKTTLLRAIGGFVRPAAGRIELDGCDLSRLPPHRRPVNTMFQSYALFPHMSVAANVAFGLRQAGVSRADIAGRVAAMLRLVRLEGLGERRPAELSGGQQQRVALARSLAPNPRLLLLDEPLSALDRGLRAETRAELVRLHAALGMTFILVTHDQDEALGMADRLAIMQDGQLIQVGHPVDLYERPASRFVASFLGNANILPGFVRSDGTTFEIANLGVAVAAHIPGRPGPGWLAVRAERLGFGADSGPNRLCGTVTDRAYAGDSVIWTVRLANEMPLRVSQPVRNGFGAIGLTPGETVTVTWHPDATVLLPE